MAQSVYQVPCDPYLLPKVLTDVFSPEIGVQDPSHPINVSFGHQTARARTKSIITDCRQEDPRPYYQHEQIVSYGSDLLFGVVCGVGEYTWINPMLYPVGTRDDNSIYHGVNELIVKNIFPDSLHKLTSAVSHELTTLGIPLWVPA